MLNQHDFAFVMNRTANEDRLEDISETYDIRKTESKIPKPTERRR